MHRPMHAPPTPPHGRGPGPHSTPSPPQGSYRRRPGPWYPSPRPPPPVSACMEKEGKHVRLRGTSIIHSENHWGRTHHALPQLGGRLDLPVGLPAERHGPLDQGPPARRRHGILGRPGDSGGRRAAAAAPLLLLLFAPARSRSDRAATLAFALARGPCRRLLGRHGPRSARQPGSQADLCFGESNRDIRSVDSIEWMGER